MLTDPATLAIAGVVLFALVAGSVWALLVGLRARREGRALSADHARVSALLQAAPALPMLVRADGQVDCPQRLADWLGLSQPPRYIAELAGDGRGVSAAELGALSADVNAAARAGKPFDRSVRPLGSERTVTLRGARAPGEDGTAGAVLVWATDATDREAQLARLGDQAARLDRAYQALTALIEVAPLPMWYRGADLKLTMVNSAYVEAVEGGDAADVIARGIELVEGQGAGGPLAGAEAARSSGRPHEAVLPATIGGKRRTLRIYDVPLTTGGVAGFAVDIEELEQARSGQKRFAEAQREMLDRLSAGVAQFGPDRSLVFSNQPFRRMFAMRSEWLADRPEFDRVLERMREADRLPEVRDFPGWKAERREWFYQTEGSTEEAWHLRGGTHLRVVAQPLPDGGLLLIFEDRTEQVQLASARDTLLRLPAGLREGSRSSSPAKAR